MMYFLGIIDSTGVNKVTACKINSDLHSVDQDSVGAADRQWTVNSRQLTVDSGHWAVDSGVDSGQWTVDSGHWAVDSGSGQWAVDSGH
jgi:hypothetical protein